MTSRKSPMLKTLAGVLAFTSATMWTLPLYAADLPAGYEAVAGSSTYEVSADGTTGTLTATDTATIGQWDQGFNIGSGFTFNALLPADGVHLSRDITSNPSEIFGSLNVPQGKFFLVNTSGIYFGPSAQVNAAGLVASTLDMQNQDFLNGKYLFSQGANPSSIINEGTLNFGANGGALLGGSVKNTGVITAKESTLALASGKEMTLSFDNAGMLSVLVDQGVDQKVTQTDGTTATDGVVNKGILKADGGKVVMTTEAANDIFDNLVNNEGIVEAQSIGSKNGEIVLSSKTSSGIVKNSGTLDASGKDAGETGGKVVMEGEKVGLMDGAKVDVSGDQGGGTVNIGGGFQGGDAGVRNAQYTYIGTGSSVKADALTGGNGGDVVIWSDNTTRFYGDVTSLGGALSGNGGNAEISGKGALEYRGDVDLSSVNGLSGTLLLDPDTIVIQGGAALPDDTQLSDNQILFGDGGAGTYTISEVKLETINANILLQATNRIYTTGTFNNDAGANDPGTNVVLITSNHNLTLQTRNSSTSSDGSTGIDLTSSTGGANLEFKTQGTGNISISTGTGTSPLAAPITVGKLTTDSGSITLNGSGTVTTSGALTTGDLSSSATSGAISVTSTQANVVLNSALKTGSVSMADANSNDDVPTSGNITVTAATSVTGNGSLTTGNATLTGSNKSGNDTATTGSISVTATAGGIGLSNATNALVTGTATGTNGTGTDTAVSGNISLTSRDEINNGTASTALKLAIGAATGAQETNTVGALTATTTGATGNVFAQSASALNLGAITTAGGSANLTTSGALTTNQAIATNGGAVNLTGSSVTANQSITTSGGNVSLSASNGVSLATTNSDVTTSGGSFTANADNDANGSGTYTQVSGAKVSTTNGAVNITASDVSLSDTVTTSGAATIKNTNGGTIGLGATAGTMTISGAELQNITANSLTIGDNTNGNITVNGITSTNSNNIGTIILNATKAASQVIFATAASTFKALTVNAGNGVNVGQNLTTAGALNVNADSDNSGAGTFTNSGALSTGGNNASITAADVALTGSLNAGAGDVTVKATNGGTIGLGATAGSMTISGSELQTITANSLTVGDNTNGNITVNGITGTNSNTIGTVILNATKATSQVIFDTAASFFKTLTVNAGNGIAVNRNLTTSVGALSLNTTGGTITQDAANSAITTGTLNVTDTAGSTTLNSKTNAITSLGTVNAAGQNFSVYNSQDVNQTGSITAALLSVTTTKNGGANINLNNASNNVDNLQLLSHDAADVAVQGGTITYVDTNGVNVDTINTTGTVNLTANGAVTETTGLNGIVAHPVSIQAGTLNLTNTGGNTTLNNGNTISTLGTVNAGSNTFSLTNGSALNQSGVLTAGTLNLTNTSGNADLSSQTNQIATLGTVNTGANAFSLKNGQALNQSGVLTAGTLNLTNTAGDTDLSSQTNQIATLGTVNTGTKNFSLKNGQALNQSGALTTDTLTLTNTAGDTTLDNASNAITHLGNVTATGRTVTLNNTLATDQKSGTAVTADKLALKGAGYALTQSGNDVNTLAANTTGAVSFTDSDDVNLGTVGTTVGVTTGGNDLTVNGGGTVTLSQNVNAGATGIVSLGTTAGGVNQTGGTLVADQLRISGAGDSTLTQTGNDVNTIAANTTGALSFKDTDDVTVGNVAGTLGVVASGDISLDAGNTINLVNQVNTGATKTVTLNTSAGGVNQTTGNVGANKLLLTGTGTFNLNNANNDVNTVAANTTGAVSVTDVDDLTVGTVGTTDGIATNGNNVTLATGDALTLSKDVSAGAGTVTLSSANGVNQTAGTLTADKLKVTGTGTFSLAQVLNNIATLAANITGGLTYKDADAVNVGSVSGTDGITASGAVTLETPGALSATQAINAGSLDATGATISVKDVTTTGDQNYNGPTTLGGDLETTNSGADITITGDTTIADLDATPASVDTVNVTTNAGDVTFDGKVDGTQSEKQSLTVTADNVAFNDSVGSSKKLNTLTVDNAGALSFSSVVNVINATIANLTLDGITDIQLDGKFSVGNLDTAGNDLSITADEIDFTGTVTGGGNLVLKAIDETKKIVIGAVSDAAGQLDITASDLAALAGDVFDSITFGSATHAGGIDINAATFANTLVSFLSPVAGAISVIGALTGTGTTSFSFTGSGATTHLSDSITTEGGAVSIDDSVVVENDVTIDTTANSTLTGADITVTGKIEDGGASKSLTLQAGTAGEIDLQDTVGANAQLDSLTATGNTIQVNGVKTVNGQTYNGDVTAKGTFSAGDTIAVNGQTTLAGSATFDTSSSNSADVELAGVTGNGNDLTVNAGDDAFVSGDATNMGQVDVTAATSVSVQNVSSTGDQTYTGADVTLNGTNYATGGGNFKADGATFISDDVLVDTTGTTDGNIDFTSTVDDDGSFGLTADAGTGAVTFGDAATVDSINLTGSTIDVQDVTTDGDQTYNGATTLNGANYYTVNGNFTVNGAATLGAATTVTADNGDIAFGSLDGDAVNFYGFTADASGAVTFGGDIINVGSLDLTGSTIDVQNVTTAGTQTYTGASTLHGDLTATGLGAGVTFNGHVTVGDLDGPGVDAASVDITTNGGNVTFNGDIDGTISGEQKLSVSSGSGNVSFQNVGDLIPLYSLSVNSSGTVTEPVNHDLAHILHYSVVTTLTLLADQILNFGTGTLTLGNVNTNGYTLTLIADEIDFLGGIGSIAGGGTLIIKAFSEATQKIVVGAAEALGTLDISTTDFAAIADGFTQLIFGSTNNAAGIDVYASTFLDAVSFLSPAGGAINILGNLLAQGSVNIQGSGSTTHLFADILTAGASIFINDNVIVEADVKLDTTNTGGVPAGADVTITGTTVSDGTARDLTVKAGTAGNVALTGAVGTGVNNLDQLNVASGNSATFGSTVRANNVSSSATTTTFTGDVTALTDDVNVNGNLQLAADSTVTTGGAAGDNFTVTGTTNGSKKLTVTAGAGGVDLQGNVGTGTALTGVTVNNASTARFGGDVKTTGDQIVTAGTIQTNGAHTTTTAGSDISLAGNVQLQNATSFNTNNGDVTVTGTVTGTGAETLGVTAGTGNVDFQSVISAIKSLIVNSATLARFGGSVTTADSQSVTAGTIRTNGTHTVTNAAQNLSLLGNVELENNTQLTTNGGDVTVGGNVNGAQSLGVTAGGGNVDLQGSVGTGTALTSVDVNGATIARFGGNVTTTGDQTVAAGTIRTNGVHTAQNSGNVINFTGNTVLENDTTLNTNNGAVTLGGTVTGPKALSIGAGTGAVSVTGAANTASVNATGSSIGLKSVTTTGSQTYNGATTLDGSYLTTTAGSFTVNGNTSLAGDTTVQTAGAATDDITFNGTVNSAANKSLTLTSTLGDILLQFAVGATNALSSLTATAATIGAKSVKTTGAQTYNGATSLDGTYQSTTAGDIQVNGAATLAGDTTVTTASGDVKFGSTVNGNKALIVNAAGGNANFQGNVGASNALTSVNATGNAVNLKSVKTSGSQTYNGPTSLDGAYQSTSGGAITVNGAATLAGDTTVQTAGLLGSDDITFNGTVSGAKNLILNAGNGDVLIAGLTGGVPLLSLLIDAATIFLNGVTTVGSQTYNGNTTLSGDLTATGPGAPITINGDTVIDDLDGNAGTVDLVTVQTNGGNVTFNGKTDGTVFQKQSLAVNAAAGDIAFNDSIGASVPLNTLTLSNSGAQTLPAIINVLNLTLSSLNLAADKILNLGLGTFSVNSINTNGFDLTIIAQEINFTGIANSVTGGGALVLSAFTAGTKIIVNAANNLTAALEFTLAELDAIANGFDSITFQTASNSGDIDINGYGFRDAVNFLASVAGAINVLGLLQGVNADSSIFIDGSGSTTNLTAGITTAGADITINDNVNVLGAVVGLDTTNGGGVATGADITVTGTVDSDVDGTHQLNLTAGTAGNVDLQDSVGATKRLASFNVLSSLASTFANLVSTTGAFAVNNTTNANFNGDVTAQSVTATGVSNVNLAGNVDVTGTGGDVNTGAAAVNLNGASGTTNVISSNGGATGTVTLGNVTAASGANLTTNAVGNTAVGNVSLNGGALAMNVDTNNNSANTLTAGTLNAGSVAITGTGNNDDVTLNGAVTSTTGSVNVQNTGNLNVNADVTGATSVTLNNASQVNLAQNVDLQASNGSASVTNVAGTIALTGAAGTNVIDSNGGDVTLDDVTSATGASLDVRSQGSVTSSSIDLNTGALSVAVDDDANGSATLNAGLLDAASVTVAGTGTNDTLNLGGAVNATAGAVSISNANLVDADADVTASTSVTVASVNTLDLAQNVDVTASNGNLDLSGAATTRLSGAAGTNVLTSNGGSVTTAAVTTTGDANLTVNSQNDITTGGVNINDGAFAANVDTDSNGSRTGTFGAITADTVTVTGTNGNDTLNFNGAINASGNVQATGGAINVNAPVNTTAGGTVTFTNALLLSIAAAADMLLDGNFLQNGAGLVQTAGDITTNGNDVTFLSAVNLTGAVSIDTNNGGITFNNTIDGNQNLTLEANGGNIAMNAAVGAGIQLGAFLINSAFNVTLAANQNITAESITQLAGTGTTSFTGDITTTGAAGIHLTGNNFTLGDSVASDVITTLAGGELCITNAGLLVLQATLNLSGAFCQLGSGPVQLFTSIFTNNQEIEFAGDVTLMVDGLELNAGTDEINFLAGSSVTDAGNSFDFTLTADEVNLLGGAGSFTLNGDILLQPFTQALDVNIAGSTENVGTLDLTETDLNALADGFNLITIGRANGKGVTQFINASDAFEFEDAITIQGPFAGGEIHILNQLVSNQATADITLIGSHATTYLNADILTSGADILINDSVVVQAGLVNLDTTQGGASAGANIEITDVVNGQTIGGQNLTMNAGTGGTILLDGAVGAGTRLGNLLIQRALNLTATDITARSIATGPVGVSGTADFNGVLDTNNVAGIDLNGGVININDSVNTSNNGTVKITNTGNLNVTGDMNLDGAFTQDGTGDVFTSGDITTSADDISFAEDVQLTGNVQLSTGAGIGNISFAKTVDSDAVLDRNLTLIAGAGNISMNGVVGGTNGLDALVISSAENVTATQAITARTITQTAGTGTTSLKDLTTSGAAGIDLNGTNFVLGGPVTTTGNGGVTVTNSGTLNVIGPVNSDGAFVQDGLGQTTLSGNITTKDDLISFHAPVILGTDVTLDSKGAGVTGAAINFDGTINGTTDGGEDLTLNAGNGNISFGAALGLQVGRRIGNILIQTANNVTADGAIKAATIRQANGAGTTTFNGTLDTNSQIGGGNTNGIELNGNDVNINQLVLTSGGGDVEINNSGALVIGANGDMVLDGEFKQTGSGDTFTAGDITTDGKAISFNGPLTLVSNVIFNTTNSGATGGANITFADTVLALAAGIQNLTLNAGTAGNILFQAAVGSLAQRLGNLTITNANDATFDQAVMASSIRQIAGQGVTKFSGTVNTDSLTGLDLTGSAFTFDGAVTTTNNGGVNVTNSGLLKINAPMTLDGAFLQDGTGPNELSGDITTTGDSITFTSDTDLRDADADQAVSLDSTAGGFPAGAQITFVSTLHGNESNLTVQSGLAQTLFNGNVGAGDALGTGTGEALTLNSQGQTTFNGTLNTSSGMSADGDVVFNDNVTLGDGTGVVPTAFNKNVTFNTGLAGKSFSAFDGVTFGQAAQNHHVNTTGAALSINTNDSALLFNSFVDGPADLTLNSGTQATDFKEAVGSSTAVGTGLGAAITIDSTGLTTFDKTVQANSGILANAGSNVLYKENVTLANGDTGSTYNGNVTFDGMTYSGFDGFQFGDAAGDVVTLSGGPVSLVSNNGNMTFQSSVTGAQALSMTAGSGDIDFQNTVGSPTALSSLTVVSSDVTRFGANVTTNGDQTVNANTVRTNAVNESLNGDLTINADLELQSDSTLKTDNAAGGNVTVTGETNGARNLTVQASAATVDFQGEIGQSTALTSVDVTNLGGTTRFGGNVKTTGNQAVDSATIQLNDTQETTDAGTATIIYNGNVVLQNDASFLTNGSDVTLNGNVTGAGKNLSFDAGNLGNVLVTGSIGTLAAHIGQLLIQNLNNFTLNNNLFANSVLQQDGQGTTWFKGDMTTDGAAGIELHGNNLTIGTTPHVQKVKTTNGGAFTAEHIPGVTGTLIINSDMDLDGGFFDLGTGPTILNGNIVTGLGGDVVFAGDLLLTDDLTTINSGGDITFGTLPGLGNVDGEADLADEDLTLTALGDINFNGEVGGNIVPGSQPRLGDLVITSAANVNAAKDMTVALLQQNAGSGTSTFNGKIDSTNGLNLTGNNFTFNDTVTTAAGGATIDNAGVLTMAEAADFTLTGGNFLQKSTAGTGTVQTAAEITTTSANDITMNSPTTLTGPVTLDSGRDINLNGSVNGAQDLTLTAGRDINTQAIGQGARIGNLVVTTVRNWLASGAIKAASIDQQAGTGTTTFNGALDTNTLAGIDLDGTAFNVNAPVNTTAGGTFTVTNAGDLNIGPNGDMTLDGAFLQDGAGNVKTAGDITTTADKIEFDAPVELTGNVAMDSNNGEIRFKDKLNGAFNLTLAADLGNIVMEQSLGGSIRLAALLIQTVVNWTANDSIFAQSITQLAGTGTSSFFGNVDTNGAAGIDLTGNNFFFGPASAVNATNLGDVDVRATLNDTSRVDMNGPVTTDGGDVTILANDDVTMAAAADVTSNGGDVVIRADQNGNGIGQLSMAYGPLDQTVVDSGAGKTTLRSGEDLLLGRVISTNAADDAVTLRSSHGKIVDGGEAQPFDVDAPNGGLVASARDGIGNASDPNGALETNVRRIDATTVSGDINFDVTSTQPLVVANATVTGGTGNIEINQLAPFSMTVQNASTVNGSITFTSIVDLIVTGNIFSGGPLGGVSLVADSNLDASGDLTIQSTSLVNAGVGLLNLYAGNNVNLLGQAITTGVAVINAGGNLLVNLLQSNHFFVNVMHDIVDVNLDGPNFVANDSSIMNAGGVIGRFKDAIDVFLSFGNLTATAQGVGAEGVSINLQGRIPDTLIFNLTPGLVLFNNIAEGGSPIQLFTTGLSSTFNLVASQPLVDNFSELQTRKGLEVGYGLTKDREKPFVPSLDLSSLEKMVRVLVSPQERKKWTGKVRPVAPTPTPVPTVPAVTPAPVVPPVTQLPQVPVLPTAPAPSPAPVYEALKPAPQPTPMPMVPPITPFPASEQARPAAPQPKPGPGLVQPTVPSGPALTPPPAGRLFQQSIEEETLEPGIPATQLMGAKPASGSPLGQYDVEETKTTEKK